MKRKTVFSFRWHNTALERDASKEGFCILHVLGLTYLEASTIQRLEGYNVLDEQTACCRDDVRRLGFQTRFIFFRVYELGPGVRYIIRSSPR